PTVALQQQMIDDIQPQKRDFNPPAPDTSLQEQVAAFLGTRFRDEAYSSDKMTRESATEALKLEVANHFVESAEVPADDQQAITAAQVNKVFEARLKEE